MSKGQVWLQSRQIVSPFQGTLKINHLPEGKKLSVDSTAPSDVAEMSCSKKGLAHTYSLPIADSFGSLIIGLMKLFLMNSCTCQVGYILPLEMYYDNQLNDSCRSAFR